MLDFDDPRWRGLHGGYRVPYDPRPALRRLTVSWSDESAWAELWNELHHQGDVGEASYAAVPALVALAEAVPRRDWNLYGLTATIEVERHGGANPPLPEWLSASYHEAWKHLIRLALADLDAGADRLTIRAALAVVALGRGSPRLGTLLATIDESEIEDYLDGRY